MRKDDHVPTTLERLKALLLEEIEEINLTLKVDDIYVDNSAVPVELLEWWVRCRGQTAGHEFTQVSGGEQNWASGIYSMIPGGRGARMDQYGALAVGYQFYNNQYGHSHWMRILLSGETDGAETVNMTLNGESDGDELAVYEQSIWMMNIDVSFTCPTATHLGHFQGGYGAVWRTMGNLSGAFTNPTFKTGSGSPLPGVSLNCPYSGTVFRIAATGYRSMLHHWVALVDLIPNGRGI